METKRNRQKLTETDKIGQGRRTEEDLKQIHAVAPHCATDIATYRLNHPFQRKHQDFFFFYKKKVMLTITTPWPEQTDQLIGLRGYSLLDNFQFGGDTNIFNFFKSKSSWPFQRSLITDQSGLAIFFLFLKRHNFV